MGKKVRSARGVEVDFDLMQIKKQIAAAPTPLEVKARQNFIENRLKRRVKKAQNTVDEANADEVQPEMPEPPTAVNETLIEDDIKEEVVSEALAAVEVEAPAEDEEPVTEEKTVVKKKRRTTKQVARPKKTTKTEDKEE
jgi:hypothetical protein